MQNLHLLTAQRRLEGEIKLREALDGREAAGAHRGLEPSAVAQLDLRPEQLLEGLGGGQRGAVDTLENGIESFERAGQAQVGQHLPEAIPTGGRGALHALSRETGIHRQRPLLDRDQRTRHRGRTPRWWLRQDQ
jgi:hypothetical protein